MHLACGSTCHLYLISFPIPLCRPDAIPLSHLLLHFLLSWSQQRFPVLGHVASRQYYTSRLCRSVDLVPPRAEGEKPSSPMAGHHGPLVVAKLNRRVEDRSECVETVHHCLIIAAVLEGAPVVGASAWAIVAQERVVATTQREWEKRWERGATCGPTYHVRSQ